MFLRHRLRRAGNSLARARGVCPRLETLEDRLVLSGSSSRQGCNPTQLF